MWRTAALVVTRPMKVGADSRHLAGGTRAHAVHVHPVPPVAAATRLLLSPATLAVERLTHACERAVGATGRAAGLRIASRETELLIANHVSGVRIVSRATEVQGIVSRVVVTGKTVRTGAATTATRSASTAGDTALRDTRALMSPRVRKGAGVVSRVTREGLAVANGAELARTGVRVPRIERRSPSSVRCVRMLTTS